ncbi:unnamed protein product, partial [Clonostachys chloroleuca]
YCISVHEDIIFETCLQKYLTCHRWWRRLGASFGQSSLRGLRSAGCCSGRRCKYIDTRRLAVADQLSVDWTFQTVPLKRITRQITVPQGKALGGFSAINSFFFTSTSKATVDG